jgi:hypothetical protein
LYRIFSGNALKTQISTPTVAAPTLKAAEGSGADDSSAASGLTSGSPGIFVALVSVLMVGKFYW